MSTLTIELPESLKKTIEALAAKEGYSTEMLWIVVNPLENELTC